MYAFTGLPASGGAEGDQGSRFILVAGIWQKLSPAPARLLNQDHLDLKKYINHSSIRYLTYSSTAAGKTDYGIGYFKSALDDIAPVAG